jgi:hypothetical protein
VVTKKLIELHIVLDIEDKCNILFYDLYQRICLFLIFNLLKILMKLITFNDKLIIIFYYYYYFYNIKYYKYIYIYIFLFVIFIFYMNKHYIPCEFVFDSNYIDSIIKEDNLSIFNNNKESYEHSIIDEYINWYKSNFPIKYFPSYFVNNNNNNNIRCFDKNKNDTSILELVYSQHFILLDNNTNIQILENIKDLELFYNLCHDYSNDIKWIINNNPLKKNI